MKALKKVWNVITYPFLAISVMVGMSREINENGEWDEYNRKRNERMMRKEARRRLNTKSNHEN